MISRWPLERAVPITALLVLGNACGGKGDSNNVDASAAEAGATSGEMSASAASSGGGSAGGAGVAGGTSAGTSTGGTSHLGGSGGGSAAGGTSHLGGSGGGSVAAGGSSVATGPGTVTDPWSDYCVATFSSDYDVLDDFHKLLFTAHAGERYLMAAYPSTFGGSNSADLFYLTQDGPFGFKVDPGSSPSPFVANCPKSTSKRFYAVFADVSLYSDSTLTTKLCDLTAGTALPLTGNYGFSLSSSTGDEAIYSIILGPYSAQCGGAENGSLVVHTIQVLQQNTFLPPIRAILGPP